MTGDEQERERGQQLLLGERVAALLDRDQRAEEVVTRSVAALCDEAAEVVGEGKGRVAALLELLERRPEVGVEAAGELSRPALERFVVLGGNAEHLADDLDRQRVGEVADHLDRALLERGVEQAVDDLLDPRPKLLDDLRCERLAHQAAQAGVVGWVEEQERTDLARGREELEGRCHVVEGPAELSQLVRTVGEAAARGQVTGGEPPGRSHQQFDLPEHEQLGPEGGGRGHQQTDQGQLDQAGGKCSPQVSEQHEAEAGHDSEQNQHEQPRSEGREARHRREMLQALHLTAPFVH